MMQQWQSLCLTNGRFQGGYEPFYMSDIHLRTTSFMVYSKVLDNKIRYV